jgi:hypothetical protein
MSKPDEEFPHLVIEWIGGECPVQAEGFICNQTFYFRSRGDQWSIGIGGEPVSNPDYFYKESYGVWPDAGFMSQEEVIIFIRREAKKFRENRKSLKN